MTKRHFFFTLLATVFSAPAMAGGLNFTTGDLVISTVSCSVGTAACNGTSGGLDTASAITLQQFQLNAAGTTATKAGSLVLPQAGNGANDPISGEYGSASEGFLEDSVNGKYLTIVGYGVNANTFNSAAGAGYGTVALGQTTSINNGAGTGTDGDTTVPRVVALINGEGTVDTTTALTGVFNQNNPRSAATINGSQIYVSGQGVTGDGTGGVFLASRGATTATAINVGSTDPSVSPADPSLGSETRAVEISGALTNGTPTLYVSRDAKVSGTPNDQTDIRALTSPSGGLPTSQITPGHPGQAARLINLNTSGGKGGNSLGGNDSSINVTSTLENGVNDNRLGKFVYLSPEQFFFANSTTMYVTDSGDPKNGSAGAAQEGEGGLQKWSLVNGVWDLDYDLFNGLNLVNNDTANSATPTAAGVTGLFGLTGEVVNGNVELFATSYGLNELSTSYLYEITDSLGATSYNSVMNEKFTTLYTAPTGLDIRGVAFAPTAVPEPATWAMLLIGFGGIGFMMRTRRKGGAATA